ncbi:type I-E CRISPR-associated protein Cse1/CasA [Leucobacter sp. HNU]|uniref:type I-E CRISPR-associated protein Cse1/CasA n=1 Tax=Leucobacter sp. HNU TaxID=3236805 RepID=UPI003A7FEFE6
MTGDRPTYSLITEPWIPCLMADGSERELSLSGVFREACSIRDIIGELPTQTFAITRLLLAILRRAFADRFEDPDDPEGWTELWEHGIPAEPVLDYLSGFADRFDLLHPVTPFFQVAELRTAKNEVKDITPLLFDVPSNSRLFTGRAGSALERLSFAEAARWLVHAHAYDPSGIKSGMVGDARAKGGKGYPIGTGWAGAIGGILIEGESLDRTLLLNLPPDPEERSATDLPPWEREPDTAAARPNEMPTGPVDLLTWQSRRIRLVVESGSVVGCVLGNGDRIGPQNQWTSEFHSAWRYSKPQTDKLKAGPVYMPRAHQLGRAFWRGISGLVVRSTASGSAGEPAPAFPPQVLTWHADLMLNGILPKETRIAPRAFGVEYGSNQSVVTDIIDDRISAPLAALIEAGGELSGTVERGVEAADVAVRELVRLAGDLAFAAGGDPEGPRARAAEDGYSALDWPFRMWLNGLQPDADAEPQLDNWKAQAETMVLELAAERVRAANAVAWQGRAMQVNGRQVPVNTCTVEQKFLAELRKNLARSNARGDIIEEGTA